MQGANQPDSSGNPSPEVRPPGTVILIGFRPFARPPVRPGSPSTQPAGFRPLQPGVRPSMPTRPVNPGQPPSLPSGFRPIRPQGSQGPSTLQSRPGFVPQSTIPLARPNHPMQNGSTAPSFTPSPNQPQRPPLGVPPAEQPKPRRVYPGMTPAQSVVPSVTQPFQQTNPIQSQPGMGQQQNPVMQPPFNPSMQGSLPQQNGPFPTQFNAPGMGGMVPQMAQPSPYVPQQQAGFVSQQPQFGSQQPQFAPQMGQPSPYAPQQPGFNAAPLQAGFQNMTLNAPTQPNGMNLMAGPPSIDAFETPVLGSNIISQAVAQSPHSNSPAEYKQCTLNAIPQTAALLDKTKLPFGVILSPYRQLLNGDETVPVIQSPQIIRCRRCRTYINPWIQFIEQGTRWKCNVCFLSNDVPSFFDWDPENRTRVDRLKRPELTHGVVEYIAPQEYMVRPPQPVVMVFVIDVSVGAVQSGMIAVAAKAILDSLDRIPNTDDRTKIGFITFDSSIHYYNLAASNTEPQMFVVADLEQPYLPLPYDLLVSLTECRPVIETFLQKLPTLFGNNLQTLSAMGKALKSAEKLVGSIGGKIICLQHALPNHDEGALKPREDPKLLGTAKEALLLSPAIVFYKNFAVDCSPNQISLDLFLFNGQYADVATLSGVAKYTGGAVFFYQGFNAARAEDAIKFGSELSHLLTRPLGLEAVLRIRASKGIKMSMFHGNFFLRSTDLLSLPNVSPDNAYTIECSITEDIKSTTACFQTALLYTSSNGERRIRVLTLSLPVTTSIGEIYVSADHHAIASLLIKKAVDRSLTSKVEDARDALNYKLQEILSVYKANFNQSTHPQQLMICENLKLLPVYILGIIKNLAFKDSNVIPSDVRSYMLSLHYVLCTQLALVNLYPRFWSIQSFISDPQVGLRDEMNQVKFPTRLNLSSEKLDRGSVFILDNGLEIFLWIGRAVGPELLDGIFGQPSLDLIAFGKSSLPVLEKDLNKRIRNLIASIRETRLRQATLHPPLYIIREDGDPQLRMWFLSHLIEDRVDNQLSYPQFLGVIREKVQKK